MALLVEVAETDSSGATPVPVSVTTDDAEPPEPESVTVIGSVNTPDEVGVNVKLTLLVVAEFDVMLPENAEPLNGELAAGDDDSVVDAPLVIVAITPRDFASLVVTYTSPKLAVENVIDGVASALCPSKRRSARSEVADASDALTLEP